MRSSTKVKISTFGSGVTAAISVALVLVLFGAMAMTLVTSRSLANDIRGNMGIVVKVLPGAVDAEVKRVERTISRQRGISEVVYSSPEKILSDESTLLGEDISSLLGQNPFGGEFDVRLEPRYANGDSIAKLASAIMEDPSVDEVVSQTEVVNNVNSMLNRLSVIFLIVALALLVVSFVLICNTVSLSVYSRRFVIHTMKLVGATASFIRRPFLIAGITTGLVAAIVACGLLAAIRAYASTFDAVVDTLLPWTDMTWIFAALFGMGITICLVSASIATNRYLRAHYDDMFK